MTHNAIEPPQFRISYISGGQGAGELTIHFERLTNYMSETTLKAIAAAHGFSRLNEDSVGPHFVFMYDRIASVPDHKRSKKLLELRDKIAEAIKSELARAGAKTTPVVGVTS